MSFKTLLQNRPFVFLWASQICSQLSYNLLNFSLLFIVYRISHSAFNESLLILTFILPTALFGTFTGIVADFHDKKKIMLFAHLLWPLVALLFVLAAENFILILILSFIINAIDRFFTPAEQSSLPFLVTKEELMIANSLFSFSINACFLIGFSLSGPLMISTRNDLSPIYLAAMLMFISTFFVQCLPNLKPLAKNNLKLNFLTKTFEEIKSGFEFVKNKKIIFWGIVIYAVMQILMNISLSVSPSFVSQSLGFEDAKHASWVVMFPVGLGSILSLYIIEKKQKVLKREIIATGLLLASISLSILGLAPMIYQALEHHFLVQSTVPIANLTSMSMIIFIACLALGLSVTLILVPALTAISQNSPPDIMGRVWGITSLVQNLLAAVPLLAAGFLADRVSVVPLILALSFVGIVFYLFGRRQLFAKLL